MQTRINQLLKPKLQHDRIMIFKECVSGKFYVTAVKKGL
jgi:hypothetical protein